MSLERALESSCFKGFFRIIEIQNHSSLYTHGYTAHRTANG